MSATTTEASQKGTLVQIASYNTNLQGNLGLPQDLVDWLSPTLKVSKFLTNSPEAPDIVAVGFQELLPLHLGFTGLSRSVIRNRDALIRSQIEKYAPNKETYSLVAHEVFVGVALLVYVKDEGIGRRVREVQTSWTGCGPLWMGNKGAVGIRFRVAAESGSEGEEVFTFVNAHLTAHAPNLKRRIGDWNHIVRTLLFPPVEPDGLEPSTIYSTSHLFFLGDLNFRLEVPEAHPLRSHPDFLTKLDAHLNTEDGRKEMLEFDQLTVQRRKGTIFQGLFEADTWRFKCTYKFQISTVDQYSAKRMPSWTDRILYATYTDSPAASKIFPLLYTSIPSYTTSDHKPIVAMLLIPVRPPDYPVPTRIPLLKNTPKYKTDSHAILKRYIGKSVGRMVGVVWFLFVILGLGNAAMGMTNVVLGIGALTWWRRRNTGEFGERLV